MIFLVPGLIQVAGSVFFIIQFLIIMKITQQQEFPSQTLLNYEKRLKKWGIAVATGVVLMLPSHALFAQPVPKGTEFLVNTETVNSKGYPQVAMDDEGDFVVCWQSYGQDGEFWGIYAQRFDSSGVAQGTEFRVNTYTANTQQSPSIGMESGGNFVIAWQSFAQNGFHNHIYAQRYHSSGIQLGGEFRVSTGNTSSQTDPSVAWDGRFNYVIAWTDNLLDGDQYGIFARRYKGNGVALSDPLQANTLFNADQDNPSVGRDQSTSYVVVWESEVGDGNSSGIRGQRYNSNISSGAEFLANSYYPDAQKAPDVAMYDNGGYIVVWQSFGQDGDQNGIFGRRFNYNGIPLGAEFQVNTTTAGDQIKPAITIDSNNGFIITWENIGPVGYNPDIYARRYHADGSPDGNEFLVNAYTMGTQINPSVAMDSDGDFVVTWESSSEGDHEGIYAQRFALPCNNPQMWYYDNDQDGFGAGLSLTDCEQLTNTVANNADCNDTAATIHPGSDEICNGVDDDCNGETDDNLVSCPYPDMLSTSDIYDISATLHWTTAPCANEYKILLVRLSDNFSAQLNGDLSGSTFIGELVPATQYKWMVKTKCASGLWSVASPWEYFTTADTDFQQIINDNTTASAEPVSIISLYPNPAKGTVRVICTGQPFRELIITDMNGRIVWQQSGLNSSETDIDISLLVSGVYHVMVVSTGASCRATLVVLK